MDKDLQLSSLHAASHSVFDRVKWQLIIPYLIHTIHRYKSSLNFVVLDDVLMLTCVALGRKSEQILIILFTHPDISTP